MTETCILFSDSLENLIFARENSERIFRYASDFEFLKRLVTKFGSQKVIAHDSVLNENARNFLSERNCTFSSFSSNAELGKLLGNDGTVQAHSVLAEADMSENIFHISPTFSTLVGSSPVMRRLRSDILRIASVDVSVLILGETGTGKSTVARALHELSSRREKPFRSEILSNSNESLVESKLFGVADGGFTGAVARKGVFEEADGGTLFLDEIGEISPNIQTKLLQVLSEGIINRIGSNKSISVDNRMIFATNANLEAKIRQGTFREDLLYRINDVTLRFPPLRERLEDIPDLCRAYLKREKITKDISDSAIKTLQTFSWKGNVRQLEKVLKNAALLYSESDVIEPKDIRL